MERLKSILGKYRYVLLVALAGLALMLIPAGSEAAEPAPVPAAEETLESRLEAILSRIDGAGEVKVLLTEAQGVEVFYQTEGEGEKTGLISGSDRTESGLIRTPEAPSSRGAVVVCRGADSAAVRLAVVEAVANATGLGTDRITVLKMK